MNADKTKHAAFRRLGVTRPLPESGRTDRYRQPRHRRFADRPAGRQPRYDHHFVKLPNAEHAIADIVKLRDYSLNQSHPRGRHKARVCLAALDLQAADADELVAVLLESARVGDAIRGASVLYLYDNVPIAPR
jgi:hypothetical protein